MDVKQLREQILKQIEQLPREQAQALRQQIEAMSDEELIAFIKRKQEETKAKTCFFCEVAKGSVDVIKVYENKSFIAFLDAYPAVIGHTIIISKDHKQKLQQFSNDELAALYDVIKKIINTFYTLGFSGYNLIINEGKAAGQNLEHFSIYLLPRKENDGVAFGWQKIEASKEQLEAIGKKMYELINKEKEREEQEKRQKEALRKVDEIIKFLKERKP